MPVFLPTLGPTESLPDPLNLRLETAVISGSLHKLYLSNLLGCTNIIVNGGAANTTDWTNPTDGVAQYWSVFPGSGNATPSIVTGNGFIGNAQRFYAIVDVPNFTLWNTGTTLLQDGFYRVTFKYRSSFDLGIIGSTVGGGGWSTFDTVPTNTGNAANSGMFILEMLQDSYLSFGFVSSPSLPAGNWFEVDEVHCCTIS